MFVIAGSMRQRVAIVTAIAILLAELSILGSIRLASAHGPTHTTAWTPGEAGPWQNNEGHFWFQVYSPNSGFVTSGGQYHDNCGTLCNAALGGDTALDIGATGTSYLWAFPAGIASGAHYPPNTAASDMYVYLYANPVQNFRTGTPNGTRPACDWRKYGVYVSYQDIYGDWHWNWAGDISIAHNTNWTYTDPNNPWIFPNSRTPSPFGSG